MRDGTTTGPPDAPAYRPSVVMAAASGALVLVAVLGSFAASPLFAVYAQRWDLDPAQVSLAFAGYPVGVIVVVTLLGGLSDLIGRRVTMLLGVALVLLACLVTAAATTLPVLVAGRFVQGMATGMVSATTAAALLDFHPRGTRAGSLTHAVCTTLGMGFGPLIAGLLADHTAYPLVLPYVVIGAVALVPLVLLLRAPADRRTAGRVRLVRTVRVPRAILLPFSIATCSLMTLNSCMALFGTFGARILTEGAGISTAGGTGGLLTLLVTMTLLAQIAANRVPAARSVGLGVLVIAAGAGTTTAALHLASGAVTIAGTVLVGTGGGLVLLGATRLIGYWAPTHRRAEVFAAWMVAAFATLGGTSLLGGLALGGVALTTVMAVATGGITTLAAYTLVAVAVQARRDRRSAR
ncbi:MFS transporter [Verrucosispora sp. SN26_14.1]|uniref:MFS transporter n=1 Tax=Verrucosispora sp. SN26_14.1 TaxID=2527879 RepID=UPI001033D32D|nr:MFS transporter [Verrucosispora sp. SN26_14.1]TBL35243.1 MFS transporter [Verrucosispora sp. SN26_14.1]